MRLIRISSEDNVAIAVTAIEKGSVIDGFGFSVLSDVPQGHKVALEDMRKGDKVIRYGVELGTVNRDVQKGEWINEKMIDLPLSPALSSLRPGNKGVVYPNPPERKTFLGYDNGDGRYAGTRNLLGIATTVQCTAGVLRIAAEKIRKEILPKYPNVDGVSALIHPYGCGVAINATDAYIPIRNVSNLIHHPNFGGELMVVGLGCEKLTFDRVLAPDEINDNNVLVLQKCHGFADMVASICRMAEKKLQRLNERKRTELPLDKLIVGTQCGGSDAFSGISANPSIGRAFDMLAANGATVMFSEVTEVRDGVHFLADRCSSEEVVEKLKKEIGWYDEYLAKGGADRSANPTPGNKAGGLSNIVEKAMGSIAKSGHSPIAEVIGPGELPTKHGLIFAATPASDIVCGPTQLASGITLQVFSTGRGTPYSLAEIPVMKISTHSELFEMWPDLFDVDAGGIVTGTKSIDDVGRDLYNMILDVASGKKSKAEALGLYNDLVIDNPATIT